jgi:Fe-S oxidoreductase
MWAKSKRYNKICPISSHFHYDSYSCQGLMDISLAILDGEIDYNKTLADIVFHCTLCGACDVMCKRTLETERLLVIEELRRGLVEKGLAPKTSLSRLSEAVERHHNVFGAPEANRFSWLDGKRKAALKPTAKMAYFVGCTSSYKHPEIARATVDLLQASGVDFMLLEPEEWCCGNPLLRSGLITQAGELMGHHLQTIRTLGVETIVTSCAECYHVWKVDYPRQHDKKSLGYDVLHITEVLADRLQAGTLKFTKPVDVSVTYHDSCRMGRLSEPHEPWSGKRLQYGKLAPPKTWRRGTRGIYSPPRAVLQAIPGVTLLEMERVRENTFCCGAGAAVKWLYRDFALETGMERLTEASDTGAKALVSSCPFCKWNFQDAASKQRSAMEILDIVEIASRALS